MCSSWQGGGLYILGTATLTDTNVYENQASWVCSPVERELSSIHPAPRWNVTCARGWQEGGGIYVWGTGAFSWGTASTLTNTNVYHNEAPEVCACLLNCP